MLEAMRTFAGCLTSRDTRCAESVRTTFEKKGRSLAALVLLTSLATLAATDVYNIERIEGCAQP